MRPSCHSLRPASTFTLAAAAPFLPQMQSGLEALGPPLTSSLTARRPAAPHLSFELPPPPLSGLNNKFSPFSSHNTSQPSIGSGSVASVGNLPTPPNTVPGEGLHPPQAGHDAGHSGTQPSPSYTPSDFWGQSQHTQYGPPATPSTQWTSSSRAGFSPSAMGHFARGATESYVNSGGASQGESFTLPPFMSSSAQKSNTLPAIASHHQAGIHGMGAPTSANSSVSFNHNPSLDGSPFGHNPPTPSYQAPPISSAAQQAHYAFPSPTTNSFQSPTGPLSAGSAQSQPQYQQRPFGQMPLPGMAGGPVMSNLHSPNANMALVGNMVNPPSGNTANGFLPNSMMPVFTSGQAANMHHIYGPGHHGSHPRGHAANDRPFRCDQCPQSFNRNHDLKRHKRIHLAVKPYPCGHCDKAFSRKDALKVCIRL